MTALALQTPQVEQPDTEIIFDDRVYWQEALLLSDSETEDDLDARLILDAQKAGIENPLSYLDFDATVEHMPGTPECLQPSVVVPDPKDCLPVDIKFPSRMSQDTTSMPLSLSSAEHPSPRRSFTAEYYQRLRSGESYPRPSSVDAPRSLSVADISSVSRSKRRSGGILSRLRQNLSRITSRKHMEGGPLVSGRLDSSHTCNAPDVEEESAVNCRGTTIPGSGQISVSTPDELEHMQEISAQSGDLAPSSPRDSGIGQGDSDDKMKSAGSYLKLPDDITDMQQLEPPTYANVSMETILEDKQYLSLHQSELLSFQRITSFESAQRAALSAHLHKTLTSITSSFSLSKTALQNRHHEDIERLEERHLQQEAELRITQDKEARNMATAVKHIKGYCTNPLHLVSDADHAKLARQMVLMEKLPAKHMDVINVLRAKQERSLANRRKKHADELALLDDAMDEQRSAAWLEFIQLSARLSQLVDKRRRRVWKRWDLRYEIWRRGVMRRMGGEVMSTAAAGVVRRVKWLEGVEGRGNGEGYRGSRLKVFFDE